MTSRSKFIKSTRLVAIGVSMAGKSFATSFEQKIFISKRQEVGKWNLQSEAVEATILRVKIKIDNPELAWLLKIVFHHSDRPLCKCF